MLRLPAPYNLRSLRDLYTQIPDQTANLKRFGSEVFLNRDLVTARGVSARDTPLDIPIGPDYVIGPGDTLTIDMWGSVTVSVTRVVDRSGRILLPEAGSVQVAGLTLERAQSLIGNALKQQYRNAQAVVTVSHLRSVRVYVVGDVQRPGRLRHQFAGNSAERALRRRRSHGSRFVAHAPPLSRAATGGGSRSL